MMKSALFAALALTASAAALAEDAAPEKAQVCTACHGPNGAKPILPEYPVLAGQYANYLEHALHEYKAGTRKNPVMGAQASQLSDDEIHALAHWFSLQKAEKPLYTPTILEHKVDAAGKEP